MKDSLKKIIIIVLCVLSHVSSIVTIITGYKETIQKMSEYITPQIANIFVVANFLIWPIAFFLMAFYLCYAFSNIYRERIGTHRIPCSFLAMWNYRLINNSGKILSSVHQDIYHEYHKLRHEMRKKDFADYTEAKSRLEDFLGVIHQSISKALQTDFTISVMQMRMNREDQKLCLVPLIHYRSAQSRGLDNQRSFKPCYHILSQEYDNLSDYVIQSKNYTQDRGGNNMYDVNSIFTYLLTHRTVKYWMSNDLRIDEQDGKFYTSCYGYYDYCKSFAAFTLVPPNKHISPKGIIVFDSHKTGTIVEKECVSMFGFVAHLLYDLIEELEKYAA